MSGSSLSLFLYMVDNRGGECGRGGGSECGGGGRGSGSGGGGECGSLSHLGICGAGDLHRLRNTQ